MSIWDKSAYLDFTASGVTTATTVVQAYGLSDPHPMPGSALVALVLPRAADPTSLLSGTYAQREAVLNGLTPDQVGARYGTDATAYDALKTYLQGTPGVRLADPTVLVSSAAARTIWIDVTSQGFQTLFGTPLLTSERGFPFWNGLLSPNANLGSLTGLWLARTGGAPPATAEPVAAVTLADGPQGVANTAGGGYDTTNRVVPSQTLFPDQIAKGYHFPMQITGDTTLATPAIGLIEPGIGNAVAPGDNANTLLATYRNSAGVRGTGTLLDGQIESTPQTFNNGERSLDVGVVAAAAPNSDIISYAGNGSVYSAFQEAVWDGTKPSILSSSFGFSARPSPGSPFDAAVKELFVDAALNNITVFGPAGDGGSSGELATGGAAIIAGYASPYVTMVGGTSTSDQAQVEAAGAAITDGGPNVNAGVAELLKQAIAGNVAALEILVAGGMRLRPTEGSNVARILQTAWNEYRLDAATGLMSPSYAENAATGGGVDPNLLEPGFQKNAGIDTRALQAAAGITPAASPMRGMPDVSALAGGTMSYVVPKGDLTGLHGNGGTSAATPLWAALAAQIQAVFTDQGLPALGTINDLLYQAAAISPAAFDDVQFGSNTSSFVLDPNGAVTAQLPKAADGISRTETITPTGIGYSAGRGYDLVSGLGTPNGVLLARAMTQIAQLQIHAPNAPGVTDATGTTSAATQALILQPHITQAFTGSIEVGGTGFTPASSGSGLGWSARIAQQVLQSHFDPSLVRAIGAEAQAASAQTVVAGGQTLSVSIGGSPATAVAQADTSQFGFVTYAAGGQTVTLARPLAVAHTYGGQNDTNAILRIRQVTTDEDKLSFYRVDDLVGTIDGIAPGEAGYAAAAASREYRTPEGNTDLGGPGVGEYRQTTLTDVDNGDIIGFRIEDRTSGKTSWGLSAQNADGANDLWSYGANTWGFDDGSGGGHGYNSLVFQLDFTSNAGSGLLAFDSTPACFVAGTRIATPDGERAVERLAIGDLVTTAAGRQRAVRWIGRRSYAGPFLASQPGLHPIRFRPGSLGGGLPRRDLLVSPEHAMLIDGVLVPARCLLDGDAVVQEDGLAEVAYLHIELDSHDAILAEGAASETFVDDQSRGIFQNAAEYAALYPEARPVPARFCAERLREGEALAALLRRLADRRRAPESLGPLMGRLEQAGPIHITGWAFDRLNTDRRQRLRITGNGVVLATVVADRERPDLRHAGYGDGRLGFSLTPDPPLPSGTHAIRVCREQDGALLGEASVVVAALAEPVFIHPPSPKPTPAATLRGCLDEAGRAAVRGWAWDPAAPHGPVALQVVANGRLVATGTANRFRRDLLTAGIGTGWHGFDIELPHGLSPLSRHVVEIRRQSDGTALPGEPVVVEAVQEFGPELEQAIHQVVDGVPDGPEGERVLSFILAQADRLRSRRDFARQHVRDDDVPSRRALIIGEHLPQAGQDGGSEAVLGHARALQALGFGVSLVASDAAPGQAEAEAGLRALGIAAYAPPHHASVEEVLRRQAGRFDLVYLHRHGPASRYLGLVRAHQPDAQVIYSVAELHHVRLGRQATLSGDARLLGDSRRMQRSEFALAAQSDAVITHSQAEAAMLRQALPGASIHCVGWAPKLRRVTAPLARRKGLAFVGSFAHAPNGDAALWLVHDVMPLVWRENPAITCTLAGSFMPSSVRRLSGPGLVVAGHVPDLHALFSEVRLTVAPLRFGAGLKAKVLDSFAAGLPCALTPIAAEGLPLPPALRPSIGHSAAELAAIILRLHDQPVENRCAVAAGHRMIGRHYSEDAVARGLDAVLASATGSSTAFAPSAGS